MGKVDTTCAAKRDIWVGKSSEWIYKFPRWIDDHPWLSRWLPGNCQNRRRFEKTVFWPWDHGGLRGNGEYQSWLSVESWGPCARHLFCPRTQNGELDQFNSPNRITWCQIYIDVGCRMFMDVRIPHDILPMFWKPIGFDTFLVPPNWKRWIHHQPRRIVSRVDPFGLGHHRVIS